MISVLERRFPAIPSAELDIGARCRSVLERRFPAIPSGRFSFLAMNFSVLERRFPAIPSNGLVAYVVLVVYLSGDSRPSLAQGRKARR